MHGDPLTNEQRLARVQNYVDKMPSLSTTVTKVLEICNLPNPSPNDLNRVISLDPVLTGQVLKLINSAYYSLPNQITSLTRAIIMLGLNTVKNLALSTAVLGCLGKKEAFQSLPMDPFWTHSICVGVTSKALAQKKKVPLGQQEEYFVAGLLHDLGKIALNNCFPGEYRQALELAVLEQGPLHQSETLILGVTHGLAGQMIGRKWQLNAPLLDVLCYHHDPDDGPDPNRQLIAIVALANLYANLYEIGTAGDLFPQARTINHLLEILGFSWEDLQGLGAIVEEEIEKARIFLQVSQENKLS